MTRDRIPLAALEHGTPFADRHVGPRPAELARMLDVIGVGSLDELVQHAVPESIREREAAIELPPPATETQVLAELRALADRNRPMTQMIGLGYYGTVTPGVILRNVLESPAWYTAYTPYQPEISQGRLEALLNFQTMVCDLTGMPVANASLLDEATAAAEAMPLLRRASRSGSGGDRRAGRLALPAGRSAPFAVVRAGGWRVVRRHRARFAAVPLRCRACDSA